VHNLLAVEVGNSLQCLLNNRDSIALSKPATVADPLKEFTSSSQFGDYVKVFGAFEPFVEFDDVGVVESLEEIHFVVDHMFVALDIFLCNDLDSHKTVGSVSLLNYSVSISASAFVGGQWARRLTCQRLQNRHNQRAIYGREYKR